MKKTCDNCNRYNHKFAVCRDGAENGIICDDHIWKVDPVTKEIARLKGIIKKRERQLMALRFDYWNAAVDFWGTASPSQRNRRRRTFALACHAKIYPSP